MSATPNPEPPRTQPAPSDPDLNDQGFSDDEENQAYERSQPESQPAVSAEPEPDGEPADAG